MRNSIEEVIKQEILRKALKNEEVHRRNQNEFRLSGEAYMFQDFLRRALKSEELYRRSNKEGNLTKSTEK